MTKVVVGAVLAAIAMFVWGYLFWGTPMSAWAFEHQYDRQALRQALRDAIPEPGTYVVPDYRAGQGMEAWKAEHREGPIALIFLRKAGAEPGAPVVFVLGFLHMLLTCLLIGALLRLALPALAGYMERVKFVALAGVAASVWGHLGDPIWLYNPLPFHVAGLIYDVVAWSLAGLVLARTVRPAALARA